MKLILLLFCLNIFGSAQNLTDSVSTREEIKKINSETTKDTINETNAYRLLYEDTKQTNDRLVSTVHWALGIVATIALLLVGYNVLYNFKISSDRLQNLTKTFDTKLEKARNEVSENFNAQIDNSNKEFEKKAMTLNEKASIEFDKKISSLTETYDKQTNAYRESTALQVKTLEKSIQERVSNVNEAIRIRNEELDNKITILTQQLETAEKQIRLEFEKQLSVLRWQHQYTKAWLWQTKGIKSNELRAYKGALEQEITLNMDYEGTLSRISDLLGEIEDIEESDKTDLLSLLEKSKANSSLKVEIIRKINKLKILPAEN